MSQWKNSILDYPSANLDTEKLTNLIFSKPFKQLRPYEYVLSPVIKVELVDYDYNHFFFSQFLEVKFSFNKILNYPNFQLGDEEVEILNLQTDISYDINDPSNFYCLGILNEEDNNSVWKCISRNIININENSIKFKIPFPGIYAVIYSPLPKDQEILTCGFVCQYKKYFYLIFFLGIPTTLLLMKFVHDQ